MKKSSVVLASLFVIWIVISLIQLWADLPAFVIYSKISFSFLLIGGAIFFSSLITNEHLVGDLRIASIVAIGTISLWATLSLIQLWGHIIDESLYIKLTITMLLVGGGILIISMVRKSYTTEKELREHNFID
jgi:hypothetical protein